MPSKETYLVIGGAGFLGSYIVQQLLDRNETVSIMDLRLPDSTDPRLKATLKGDITDLDSLRTAFSGYSVVIHTASPVHEGLPTSVYWKVNVEGTKKVIQACVDTGVKKLIYTSSASVSYYGQNVINEDETAPYCEVHMNVYNQTKALGEQAVLESNGKGGLLTIALRPAGIFGPAQGCYVFLEAAKKGNHKVRIGQNATLFDYTYVENIAYAHLLAADKLAPDNGSAGEAFIITNDEPIFFWDFTRYFHNALGMTNIQRFTLPKPVALALGHITDAIKVLISPVKKIDPTFSAFRVNIITSNRYLDCTKAKRILGYEPLYTMEEALQKTMVYWKKVWEEEKAAGRA